MRRRRSRQSLSRLVLPLSGLSFINATVWLAEPALGAGFPVDPTVLPGVFDPLLEPGARCLAFCNDAFNPGIF